MQRNVMKIIEDNRGTIPIRYDLSWGEVKDLLECAARKNSELDRLYTAIYCAFCVGFVLGSRATLKGVFKERK